MKKFVSILLLSILLFNWIGYQFYISLMEHRADQKMIARIDKNNYSEDELISIKVPVTYLYYYAGSTGYERIDGKVEIEGVQYNYVKRRFFNDSLELLCIPNPAATHLQSARENFFTLLNDIQRPGHSKNPGHSNAAFKSLNEVFSSNSFPLALEHQVALVQKATDKYIFRIPVIYLSPGKQPPNFI